MAIRREGRWLIPEGSAHCAFEVRGGAFRLSLLPGRLVSPRAAVAGLTVAEMATRWGRALWVDDANSCVAWGLIQAQARTVGVDALDLVMRSLAGEVPADAAALGAVA